MEVIVAELIEELEKYPKGAEVAWRSHDQSENEISDRVRSVEPFDPETSFDPWFCRNVSVVLSSHPALSEQETL